MAIASPLLDVSINGAHGVLFNITGGRTLGLHELNAAAQVIAEVVDPDAEIIFGTAIDPKAGEEVKITVIATGFQRQTMLTAVPDQYRKEPPPDDATDTPDAQEPLDEEAREPVALRPAVPDINDTELPTFLRRTVTAR
jgi:cell division protein FtsZ